MGIGVFRQRSVEEPSAISQPETVDRMMKAGLCDVTVDATDAVWHGVTYAEDKPNVVRSVRKLIEAGEYPAHLWGENHEE